MKSIASLALVVACAAFVTAADEKPVTPAEALKRVDKAVYVRFEVKAVKDRLEKRGEIYIDSEEDFMSEKNLAVVVTKEGAKSFADAGIKDVAEHVRGKTIKVRGKVTLKDERPRIEVTEAKQITVE